MTPPYLHANVTTNGCHGLPIVLVGETHIFRSFESTEWPYLAYELQCTRSCAHRFEPDELPEEVQSAIYAISTKMENDTANPVSPMTHVVSRSLHHQHASLI